MHLLPVTALVIAGLNPVLAGFDPSKHTNVAIYWGQNSAQATSVDRKGPPQDRLSAYCADPSVDIILISFLLTMHGPGGEPDLNFANHGRRQQRRYDGTQCDHTTTPITCPAIEKDIKYCQEKGVTVMLSIGGSGSYEVGYTATSEATNAGEKAWQMFGPDQGIEGLIRPFGSTVVDGFDLDFEHPVPNVVTFGKTISNLMYEHMKKHGGQKFYMSAAPECPLPNPTPSIDATNNEVPLDMVFVQFYNNSPCDLQGSYNFQQWNDFAKKKNMVFFVGLPANVKAAPNGGYVAPENLAQTFAKAKGLSQFRGASLWDASQAWWNDNYQQKVKAALKE